MELLFFIVGGILLGIFLEVKFGNKTKDNLSNIPVPQEAIIFRCPRCHSTAITANQKGFGVGKAAIGAVALGPIGLLAGGFGSKKVKITCLRCGHQWAPNDNEVKWDEDYQKTEYRIKHASQIISTQLPIKKYLKASFVNADLAANTAAFSNDSEKVNAFTEEYMNELSRRNTVVVSDEEFHRITGQ